MGRGPHCSLEKKRIIWELYQKGTNQSKIAEIIGCSRKMVYNVIKSVSSDANLLNVKKKRNNPPRNTTVRQDKAIVRKSKIDPFKSSRTIMTEINQEFGINVSSRLVRRRLNENNLYGRVSRKKPLLSKKNIKGRLSFAKLHKNKDIKFWKRVLFTDETKINLIGPDGKTFVHREKNQEYNPRYTTKTVKHGGGNLQVWGSFSWYGVGPIERINGNMDKFYYLDILKNTMEPYCFESMPLNWIFMQDNDPKHTAKVVKDWISKEKISILDWPAQSPDLNPIENLWNDVKVKVGQKKFKNCDELWEGVKEAWNSIPLERCQKLIESLPRRCEAVLSSKGYSTKY